ncbi:DUF2817 domain-containing protein [Vibrio sp. VPAP30]|uniref:DUF2817 domain-containing protein n=1 Tax=Vibrio sp. VPAP30 TaxID=1647102 RepID=UPI000658E468|nr:DUF2817 domain-containing protein [Vibrio sp. VPAP30]KLN65740.1 zinc carboxypeptidase [Vibrio sp. VPAP30]
MIGHIPREIQHVEQLAELFSDHVRLTLLDEVQHQGQSQPLYCIEIGTRDRQAPCLFFTGAIHGVERIGSQIILAFTKSLLRRLEWDQQLQESLARVRIVAVPVVNPWGVALKKRANHNGVDLMRNAPIDSANPTHQLYAGQSFSSVLPWYRGNPNKMEQELQTLSQCVLSNTQHASSTILLDLHSGFGTRDRLWFPYAYSKQPPSHLAHYYLLYKRFRSSYPHYKLYQFEPQWHQYTTHGDFWDWMLIQHKALSSNPFLPLTLELGSWLWVKKNPIQVLKFSQLFHPIKPHRIQRVQRRHSTLLSYLIQVLDNDLLTNMSQSDKEKYREKAKKLWYRSC